MKEIKHVIEPSSYSYIEKIDRDRFRICSCFESFKQYYSVILENTENRYSSDSDDKDSDEYKVAVFKSKESAIRYAKDMIIKRRSETYEVMYAKIYMLVMQCPIDNHYDGKEYGLTVNDSVLLLEDDIRMRNHHCDAMIKQFEIMPPL